MTHINQNQPILRDGQVTPNYGFVSTYFIFTMNYSDSDNNEPSYVNITINSQSFSMEKANPFYNDYIKGVIYQYNTTLPEGVYEFYFNASDGLYFVGLPVANTFFGPSVYSIRNYTMYDGVSFEWIDITDSVVIPLTDDSSSMQFLPFQFQFYNETYSKIYISSNGYMSFTNSTPHDPSQDAIPSLDEDNQRLIALLWDDLNPTGKPVIFVKNLTNPNRWVLEYCNISHFGISEIEGSFELILYETGEIKFQFLEISYFDGYSSGLNFGDGSHFNNLNNLLVGMKNYTILFIFNGIINIKPVLNSSGLTDSWGYVSEPFTFRVRYIDLENETPIYVRIIIDGVTYNMQKQNMYDDNYVDGTIYSYTTTLALGNHTYYFEASDGVYLVKEPSIYFFDGPEIRNLQNGHLEEIIAIILTVICIFVVALLIVYRKKKKTRKFASIKQWPLVDRNNPKVGP